MAPVTYEKQFKVPYFLTDRYQKMDLHQLMNVLIETSGEQTAQIGALPVHELGLSWIIIQYDLNIQRMPEANETIMIRTYAKEYNRLFSYREFEVYDKNGELLVYVMTVFALINEERRLTKIPVEVIEGYGSSENRRIKRMPKPTAPDPLENANQQQYQVGYFDIDSNFHVNNSRYFLWMLDPLGDGFLSKYRMTKGNVVYEKEIHKDEEVVSFADIIENDDEELISRHQLVVDGVVRSTATFTWKEK